MQSPEKHLKKYKLMSTRIFLSAHWEYLAMFNYEVDPQLLQNHLPPYTEIDFFNGKALVSVVGFMFNNTKVLGCKWPGHVNFEEVNLRYYIKHFDGKQWKRGVGFISEIVPKPLVAGMANLLYNEHYSSATMDHSIEEVNDLVSVKYRWKKRNQQWSAMKVQATSALSDIQPGSEEEFILEHYYGYNELNQHTTIEYAIQHPRWKIYPVTHYELDCNVAVLYGKEFVPFIQNVKPISVFLGKGSMVTVKMPVRINTKTKPEKIATLEK